MDSNLLLNDCDSSLVPQPSEWKIVSLRECAAPYGKTLCDCSETAAAYWRQNIATTPNFNPDCECFVALLLDTRRRIKGHHLIATGTLNSVLTHPREVSRSKATKHSQSGLNCGAFAMFCRQYAAAISEQSQWVLP